MFALIARELNINLLFHLFDDLESGPCSLFSGESNRVLIPVLTDRGFISNSVQCIALQRHEEDFNALR